MQRLQFFLSEARWDQIRWRIEHSYRELKTGLGLDTSLRARDG
jgi:hypothetical protein